MGKTEVKHQKSTSSPYCTSSYHYGNFGYYQITQWTVKIQERTVINGYFSIYANGKWGAINLARKQVLSPTYDSLIYRSDAGFLKGSKSNAVDTYFIGNDFTVKVSGILSEINTTDGYMKIRTNGEYKYYNFRFEEKTNRELLTGNTLFLDQKDGKYGYVNKDGVVVVDYIYDDAKEQNAFGYASVKKDGLWGCINSQGEEVVTPTYTLENNSLIEFINQWYRGEDLNLNYYTNEW